MVFVTQLITKAMVDQHKYLEQLYLCLQLQWLHLMLMLQRHKSSLHRVNMSMVYIKYRSF